MFETKIGICMPGGHCVDGNDVRYNHEQCPKEETILEHPVSIKNFEHPSSIKNFERPVSIKVNAIATPGENSTKEFKNPNIESENAINIDSLNSIKEAGTIHVSDTESSNNFDTFFEVDRETLRKASNNKSIFSFLG